MRRLFPVFLILVMLLSCRSGPRRFADNPNAILEPKKMEKVLADIEIAEGAISVQSFKNDSAKRYARAYYREVLNYHGVSVEKFQKSFKYYTHNPKVMLSMQQSVIERISAKEGERMAR